MTKRFPFRLLLAIGTVSATPAALAGAPVRDPTAGIGFDQRIGTALPWSVPFTGADGVARPLRDYFGGKPGVLVFDYFRCPEMCTLVASGAIDALRPLRASVGRDYAVVTVSIDPTDTPALAAVREREDVGHYGRSGAAAGWHTLVGRPEAIAALTAAAGFRYAYDPASRQYAHPSGLLVVTRQGVVASYFMGVDFSATELAEAIRDAGVNRTGRPGFNLLFTCFQSGGRKGPYGRLIWGALWTGVGLTVAGLSGGIVWMLRQERRGLPRRGGTR